MIASYGVPGGDPCLSTGDGKRSDLIGWNLGRDACCADAGNVVICADRRLPYPCETNS